ncbi:nicotinate phosphoribosyltransferase [Massilia sp. TS11]|uniref:nicotinate phosphoribosyltransferase n=1 Tax=Massilia sp. TS11 TaxID=2908003 RepID=UPI001EDB3B64|nr:nicotinate phosphoribosyltransferase [Massilia sp. TS11]MCG2586399.1 nicotinate phosphoribosyltransferase [Massilia sp. TS11]
MRPVVRSLLETDLYKFTMWQALLHRHPDAQAEYAFVCRNTPAFPLAELKAEVEAELDHLCMLSFQQDEIQYLRSLRYIKSDFADFLTVFRFQRHFIRVWTEGPHLHIVARGPQVHVMGFEIYVLYIVNELYFRRVDQQRALATARQRLHDKIGLVRDFLATPPCRHPFEFSDFGLRRRFSAAWQDEVVATLAQALPEQFKGSSNVYIAMRQKLTPLGTMGHEYLQSFQAFGVRLRDFQKQALEDWVQEYRGDLGIALTDVVGMDAFLADFDLYFAKLFDGLRHDSGDPFVWGEKALAHYQRLRIDAQTKRLVFSDGLDLPECFRLYRAFADRTITAFGIGTNLTNDTGFQPLNIVMKLVSCNGQSVAKLSDTAGKTLCSDETFLAYLRQVFQHPQPT